MPGSTAGDTAAAAANGAWQPEILPHAIPSAAPAGTDAVAASADPKAHAALALERQVTDAGVDLQAGLATTGSHGAGMAAALAIDVASLPRSEGARNALEGIGALPAWAATSAAPGNAAPGAAAASGVAAPPSYSLQAPIDGPDFAGALGMQVSMLAQSGIQKAELHLNPAEMGPVSIQIVLDGSQAHVAFGADVAATRSAIEAGLPELAAALRAAGLTLSGGGVSQHAHGRGDADPGQASGGHSGRPDERGGDALSSSRQVRLPVRAGGLDLYA